MNSKILIVEDELLQVLRIEKFLKKQGFDVVGSAKNAKEGLELALKYRPNIIIMDITLGTEEPLNEEGVDLALKIQKEYKVHIIYLTARKELNNLLIEKIKKTHSKVIVKKSEFDEETILENIRIAPIQLELSDLRNTDSNLVFVSYSHSDTRTMEEMLPFLNPLRNVGVDYWVDTQIETGSRWKNDIEIALEKAKVAIMLISINFMNSKFIKDIELPFLLKAAEQKGTLIMPIFISHVPMKMIQRTGIDEFLGINAPDDTIDNWQPGKRKKDCWGKLYEKIEAKLI